MRLPGRTCCPTPGAPEERRGKEWCALKCKAVLHNWHFQPRKHLGFRSEKRLSRPGRCLACVAYVSTSPVTWGKKKKAPLISKQLEGATKHNSHFPINKLLPEHNCTASWLHQKMKSRNFMVSKMCGNNI